MKKFDYKNLNNEQKRALKIIIRRFGVLFVLYLVSFIWADNSANLAGRCFHGCMTGLLGSSMAWAWIDRKENLFKYFIKEEKVEEK